MKRLTQSHPLDRRSLAAPGFRLGEASPVGPAVATLLSDEVADRLRDSILRGHFAPGDRLREEQLADTLGVSRGPIRSALAQLERERLAVRRPNRGAVVAELSRADLDEVFSLRLAIEPVACACAARHASEVDLADMQSVIDGYSTLTTSASAREAAEVDLAFHDVLYRASAHRRLLGLWEDLRPQVCVFLLARSYVHSKEFKGIMIRSHGAILEAVAVGDEDRAREVASEHVRTSYGHVVDSYLGRS